MSHPGSLRPPLRLPWDIFSRRGRLRALRLRPQPDRGSVETVGAREADPAADSAVLASIVHKWRRQGSAVETYEFPAEEGLSHDVVDPCQPEQRIDLVYPILIDRITGPDAGQ